MTDIYNIPETALYDERSAGGLVYKREGDKVLWLVIKTVAKSAKSRPRIGDLLHCDQRYVYKFPKGHLEKNEFLKQTALREVEEEARVKAKIIDKIASNDYIIWDKLDKKKIVKKVTFFLMEYLEQSNVKHYDNEIVLDREWFTYEEAGKKLAYDSEKALLKKAKIKLEALLKQKVK